MNILNNYPDIILSLLGLIGALLGVAVTHFFNIRAKKYDWENQSNMRKLEQRIKFEEEYLITPIMVYLEAESRLLSKIYQKGLDESRPELEKSLFEHISQLPMMSACVRTYGDVTLSTKFEDFAGKRLEVGNTLLDQRDRNVGKAYQALQESIQLLSEILDLLKRRVYL